MADTFAQTVRMLWIDALIDADGEINRADIASAFGVSIPQASADIRRYLSRNPGRIHYDNSRKRYVVAKGTNPLYHVSSRASAAVIVATVQAVAAEDGAAHG